MVIVCISIAFPVLMTTKSTLHYRELENLVQVYYLVIHLVVEWKTKQCDDGRNKSCYLFCFE